MIKGKLQLIYGCDFTKWAKKRIPRMHIGFGPAVSIGVGDDERLLAAVIYSQYTGHSMQLSVAADSPAWCSRRTLRAFFTYPFKDAGCIRVTGMVASDNEPSLSLCERLGFVREGVLRKALGEIDVVVFGMLREECKWL